MLLAYTDSLVWSVDVDLTQKIAYRAARLRFGWMVLSGIVYSYVFN